MTTDQYWQRLDTLASSRGAERLLEAAELLRGHPELPLLISCRRANGRVQHLFTSFDDRAPEATDNRYLICFTSEKQAKKVPIFEMIYKLIRSNRKSIAIEVHPDGILVRAPCLASQAQIDAFVLSKGDWIAKAQAKIAAAPTQKPAEDMLTMEEIRDLANRALAYIPTRVKHYAPLIGVSYGRITIRNQRSRWGSCSTKGNLNFNCLLMLTPPEVIDSVIVHELCHRKEMNHSKAFYAEVLRVFPDYWKWDKWLKENGDKLMRRMIG